MRKILYILICVLICSCSRYKFYTSSNQLEQQKNIGKSFVVINWNDGKHELFTRWNKNKSSKWYGDYLTGGGFFRAAFAIRAKPQDRVVELEPGVYTLNYLAECEMQGCHYFSNSDVIASFELKENQVLKLPEVMVLGYDRKEKNILISVDDKENLYNFQKNIKIIENTNVNTLSDYQI